MSSLTTYSDRLLRLGLLISENKLEQAKKVIQSATPTFGPDDFCGDHFSFYLAGMLNFELLSWYLAQYPEHLGDRTTKTSKPYSMLAVWWGCTNKLELREAKNKAANGLVELAKILDFPYDPDNVRKNIDQFVSKHASADLKTLYFSSRPVAPKEAKTVEECEYKSVSVLTTAPNSHTLRRRHKPAGLGLEK